MTSCAGAPGRGCSSSRSTSARTIAPTWTASRDAKGCAAFCVHARLPFPRRKKKRSQALERAVIYTPFLQQAFSTVSLSAGDWMHCAAVASSVLWLRELSKLLARAR